MSPCETLQFQRSITLYNDSRIFQHPQNRACVKYLPYISFKQNKLMAIGILSSPCSILGTLMQSKDLVYVCTFKVK